MGGPGQQCQQRTRDFDRSKETLLQGLESGKDKSLKGSLDAPIFDLVGLINNHNDYVTTSSCSGRITLFEDVDGVVCRKSGGRWLLSSHSAIELGAGQQALKSCQALGQQGGSVTLKQEPLVMHIECRDLVAAERLLKIGVASGFRESGISLGKKRILVAIRTGANSLEAPIILAGQMLMTDTGLEALVRLANEKFALNAQRTQRFMEELKTGLLESTSSNTASEKKTRRRSGEKRVTTTKSKAAAIAGSTWRWIEAILPDDKSKRLLQRWGHSLCSFDNNKAWMFGGYGWSGSDKLLARLDSTLEIELEEDGRSLTVKEIDFVTETTVIKPEAREKHAAAMSSIGQDQQQSPLMVVFGGRASPSKAFNDIWTLSKERGWRCITDATGQPPSPRWSHSMTSLGSDSVAVYGGRDATNVFGGSLHLLIHDEPTSHWRWSEVQLGGASPLPPLFLHTCTSLPATSPTSDETSLIIFGGLHDLAGRDSHQHVIHVSLATAKSSSREFPIGATTRSGHAASVIADGSADRGPSLIITGGMAGGEGTGSGHCPISCSRIVKLDFEDAAGAITSFVVRPVIAGLPSDMPEPAMIHHGSVMLGPADQDGGSTTEVLVSIGGGIQTFAFSPIFSPPMILRFEEDVIQDGKLKKKEAKLKLDKKEQHQQSSSSSSNGPRSSNPPAPLPENDQGSSCPCLLVPPHATKLVKTALERGGLIDGSRRIASSKSSPGLMAIPVPPAVAQELRRWVPSSSPSAKGQEMPSSSDFSSGLTITLNALKNHMDVIEGWADEPGLPRSASAINSHVLRFKAMLEDILGKAGLPQNLVPSAMSTHIERLGDALLIEDGAFRDPLWEKAYDLLWPALLQLYKARRIARLAPVQAGPKRQSQVKIIYIQPSGEGQEKGGIGGPGWVTLKENGMTYSFDMTKVMFSSGNISEKARIASMQCQNETVVDLYAGIGYFTLPMLVHGKASRLIACEWNPDSVLALRYNLEANGVADRAEVLFGDNRLTTKGLECIADRVHLGLLPSSEETWPIAARLLKPTGGMLHIHGNMLEESIGFWIRRVEAEISELGHKLERPWAREVRCLHLEKVKSFAPSVWHVVADVKCGRSR